MVDPVQLARSKSIHRRTGRTFYYATRLLPARVRHATYVLYAFFRVADEVVDDPDGPPPAEQRERLAEIRAAALGEEPTDDPVVTASAELRETHDIPAEEVELFLDAMATDVDRSRYETREQLASYVRGSAAAVGAMMTHVMEPEDLEAALPHARTLGEAFQMTNFLRDVGEDVVDRDRIYLPRETLDRYGVDVADLERRRFTGEFATVVERELQCTEALYREGVAGIKYLPADCQLPVLTAAVLYADHHRLIRECGYDTLTRTPSLGARRKLSLVARTRWHWFLVDDPEAVFFTVSDGAFAEEPSSASRPNDPLPMH